MVEIPDGTFCKHRKGENIRKYKLNNAKTGLKQPPKFPMQGCNRVLLYRNEKTVPAGSLETGPNKLKQMQRHRPGWQEMARVPRHLAPSQVSHEETEATAPISNPLFRGNHLSPHSAPQSLL